MGPHIAIAASGLGRVRRGNETWARGVAEALHAAGTRVTLFGGTPTLDVACPYVGVPNWPRDAFPGTDRISWRRRYLIEQRTFAAFLKRRLRAGGYDLVHVADPSLALRLRLDLPAGGPRVVYKDGLQLGVPWCRKFELVQVLAPYYREVAEAEGVDTSRWSVIPHLVDGGRFAPASDRAEVRARLLRGRVPPDALVLLAVGDYSVEGSKRLHWVLEETARLPPESNVHLVCVGQASPRDVEGFRARAEALLGPRVHLAPNISHAEMPGWYQAADVFVHAALREPFGIVFLEAMASGLPVLAHTYPVTEWIVGEGGSCVDMTEAGRAAGILALWSRDPEGRRAVGERARARARSVFSAERIVPLYQESYAAAMARR